MKVKEKLDEELDVWKKRKEEIKKQQETINQDYISATARRDQEIKDQKERERLEFERLRDK